MPPLFHKALGPRSMARGVLLPRLRSNYFAVVADLTDNLRPIFGQLQVFAVFTVGTQQPRDIRVFQSIWLHGDHILGGDAASSALSMA